VHIIYLINNKISVFDILNYKFYRYYACIIKDLKYYFEM